jgi:hypothetical protein
MQAYMHPDTARALLKQSRETTAGLRQERQTREVRRVLAGVIEQRNSLRLAAIKADARRFSGDPITGFGGL